MTADTRRRDPWIHPVAVLSLVAAASACGTSAPVQAPTTGAQVPQTCPDGMPWDGTHCAARALPMAVEPADDGPPSPSEARRTTLAPALDPALFRDHRRAPRALPLMVTEIQQLETLLQATAPAAKDRPLLLRRIAEDYVELEKAAAAESVAPGDPARRDARRRVAARSHQEAIKNYEAVLAAASPTDPRFDEATYFLAYERERGGDLAGARRGYLDLIVKSPGSAYVPMAYLAFGDMFAGEATDDPSKWELARQAFLKVLTTPPPGNAVYGYAWYRLAYVLVNAGDRDGALRALDKANEAATAFPQLPGSAELLAESQAQRRSLSP